MGWDAGHEMQVIEWDLNINAYTAATKHLHTQQYVHLHITSRPSEYV